MKLSVAGSAVSVIGHCVVSAGASGALFGLCFAQALAARGPRRSVGLGAALLGLAIVVALSLQPLPWIHE